MLEVEPFDHVHDQVRWVLPAFFYGYHLYEVLRGDKQDHFPVLTEDGVPFQMGRLVWFPVAAHYGESAHRWCHIISCLVGFLLTDLLQIVVFELEKDHASAQLFVEMPPIVHNFQIAVREHGVPPIDAGVGPGLDDGLCKRRNEEEAKHINTSILELLPALASSGTSSEAPPQYLRFIHCCYSAESSAEPALGVESKE